MIRLLQTHHLLELSGQNAVRPSTFQEIAPTMLKVPIICWEKKEHCVDQGIVKAQVFGGILVAVKQFLPRSLKVHEATILNQICYPYLPLLLSVCTRQIPLCLVMQFHPFKGLESSTVEEELLQNRFTGDSWLSMCIQLLEAVNYLHEIHNNIKMNNILVAKSLSSWTDLCEYQVELIDFGKACKVSEGKHYNHYKSAVEKTEYLRRFPHIAPQVVDGESKQSVYSDIYSFGKVMFHHGCTNYSKQRALPTNAEKCVSPSYFSHPCARKGLDTLKI